LEYYSKGDLNSHMEKAHSNRSNDKWSEQWNILPN